jgi:hypothetical protein
MDLEKETEDLLDEASKETSPRGEESKKQGRNVNRKARTMSRFEGPQGVENWDRLLFSCRRLLPGSGRVPRVRPKS